MPLPGVGSGGGDTIRVLLVEDDPDQAEIVRRALRRHEPPFEVTVVGDGAAALDAVALRPYSIVLLDYSLPRMNGLEVLGRIRERSIQVPVVMVTGQGDERIAVDAIKAGALDYVIKTQGYLTTLPTVLHKALRQHAMAFENSRLWEEAQQQLRRNETLLAVSRAASSTLYLSEILRLTTREMVLAFGASTGGAWLLTPDPKTMRPVAAYRAPKELIERLSTTPFPMSHDLARRAQELSGPLYSRDSQSDPQFDHPLFRLVPHKSLLIVPIWTRDAVIGSFTLVWTEACHELTPEDLQLAEAIARQTAIVIQNADLFAQSEARRAEAQASEQRFRDLVQELDAIVWEADAVTWAFSFVSQRAEAILGYPVEHWLSEPGFWVDRLHPDDREQTVAMRRAAVGERRDHQHEYRVVAADGRAVWLLDRVHVITDPEGRAARLRGVMVDITSRRQAEDALRESEQQFRQAQKMEAVGRIAGGIAHDFNNLLLVISGHTELLPNDVGNADSLRRRAGTIAKAAERAAGLTRQLLAFSRKQTLQPKVLDLNAVVSDAAKMLRPLIGEDIELVLGLGAGLGCVKADPGQIDQVIMNVVVNARDAMPGGGRITVDTANVNLDDAFTREHPGAKPGPHVLLAVADTGCGMTREIQAQIFEPFFTTKEHGKGTGLGLSTVYGIVKQHDGYISLESEPSKGTTFRVYLPRVAAAAEPGEARKPVTIPVGGSETILLVEDDAPARALVRALLVQIGYSVIEAPNGPEAMAISEAVSCPIHLLLSDVVMPEVSGPELARTLVPLRPTMKVLYMSGYTDDALGQHGVLDAGTALLPKPFTREMLAAKVREVLSGSVDGASLTQADARANAARRALQVSPQLM
jgi:PAS domain S-box-containing protein